MLWQMFIIGEAVIEDDVARERFACNLAECKGACCTLPGGRGAPLADSELDELQRAAPHALVYLSERHRQTIGREGYMEGVPGSMATVCIDDRDCVFVFYEDGIARCALEKAYLGGATTWRKPISCHLFPIRISQGSREKLRYERLPECAPARKHGLTTGTPLFEYLKDALVRTYGEGWYNQFADECRRRDGEQPR